MTHIAGYDDVNVLAWFGCGTVLSATDGTNYLLITDESTLVDILGPDDAHLLDQLELRWLILPQRCWFAGPRVAVPADVAE
mgnify:CR=1 FL=1